MAEVLLARDTATASWATTTLVVTAGSETTTDYFFVDKGVYGPKTIRAALTFPTPAATSVQIDLQVSQGGVIWHTIRSITNVNGDTFEFPAPQGFFRFRAVAFVGGAPTASLSLTAMGVGQDRLVLRSVGPAAGVNTEGAAVQIGSAAAPLQQDTNNTAFVSFNLVSDATGGVTAGLRVTLDSGGAMQYAQNVIYAIFNETAHVRNPWVYSADMNFAADCFVQGTGTVYGSYISFPASAFPAYGSFSAIFSEFAVPVGCAHNTGGFPQIAFLRWALSGDATAITTLETTATTAGGRLCFLSLQGFTEGTGRMLRVNTSAYGNMVASIRIMVGTTYYYIPLNAAEA